MSREIERPAKRQVYAETVMIVRHNPGLEDLVEQLIGERHDLSTAALAQIVLPIDQRRDLTLSTPGTLVGQWRLKELHIDSPAADPLPQPA